MAVKPNIKLFREFTLEQIHERTEWSVIYLRSVRQGHQPLTHEMRVKIPLFFGRDDLFDVVEPQEKAP